MRSAIVHTNDADYGRHFTVVAPGGYDKEALDLYDDNEPATRVEDNRIAQPVYMMFLEHAGHRPLPHAIYRGLSVRGADRTALMAGCFGQDRTALVGGCFGEVVAKPYEAKSDQPQIEITVEGGAPAQVYVLYLSRTKMRRVYQENDQQRKAISLLRSSPVAAWRMVANNAWQQHLDGAEAEAEKPMSLHVINGFLDGMTGCLPYGEGLALVTFCGSALKSVAARRLPETMFVESEEKYECYNLILESRVIPPGLLTVADIKQHFPVGFQAVGITAEPWPPEKERVLRRIMSEGLLLKPGVEHRKVLIPEPRPPEGPEHMLSRGDVL